MSTTGKTRRIDDLGRIQIPKDVRHQLKIHEGDAMEIFIASDNEIVLQKYTHLEERNNK